jgi:RES domain-containing protein
MGSSSESPPTPTTKRISAGEPEDVLGASERLWRVCRRPHADLSGIGATVASGRWHTKHKARRVLYCAADPSTAILEVVVRYLDEIAEGPPADLVLVTIGVDRGKLSEVRRDRVDNLPDDWPGRVARTRACGDAWLAAGEGLLLAVPSALSPAFNVVVNAKHRDVGVLSIERVEPLAQKITNALAGLRAAGAAVPDGRGRPAPRASVRRPRAGRRRAR